MTNAIKVLLQMQSGFLQLESPLLFLFDEPLKGSKSLKMFKISLRFHFDKL
jgi:hypothetical protein